VGFPKKYLIPESCTKYRSEALQAAGDSWCKFPVIISTLILVLVVGLPMSWGFENEPKTFRGIKWGTDINNLPDMIFHTQSGESKVYFRKNDKLKMGAANLLQIWYFFSMDKLYSVVIMFEEWSNFNSLKTELFKLYGMGYAPNRFTEEYRWMGSDVIVFFDYNEIDDKGRLAYYYLPIMKEQLEERTETDKKADDHP
jgi:hypothetical protein